MAADYLTTEDTVMGYFLITDGVHTEKVEIIKHVYTYYVNKVRYNINPMNKLGCFKTATSFNKCFDLNKAWIENFIANCDKSLSYTWVRL